MLRTLIHVVLVVLSTTALLSCGSKSSSNNSATSTQCLNDPYMDGCNNAMYNNYSGYGYQAYPYAGGTPGYTSDPNSMYRYQNTMYYQNYGMYGNSLCACPQGTRPVYNGSMGTGCVSQAMMPNYARTYYWSLSAGQSYNNHYVNFNQVSNINGNSANNGCYNNVAWSCLVGQNQCPEGNVCAPTAQNSPIGICVKK